MEFIIPWIMTVPKGTNLLSAYVFSVKCGLLVGENLEEKLSDEYQEFVDAVIEVKKSKDENDIQQMYR